LDFTDKMVLVTGRGAGIGRATVSMFAEHGASVVALEIDKGRAEELRTAGGDVQVLHGDATDAADVSSLATTIGERFGRLDVLVNNVGHFMTRPTPFEELTETQIDDIYDRETWTNMPVIRGNSLRPAE